LARQVVKTRTKVAREANHSQGKGQNYKGYVTLILQEKDVRVGGQARTNAKKR